MPVSKGSASTVKQLTCIWGVSGWILVKKPVNIIMIFLGFPQFLQSCQVFIIHAIIKSHLILHVSADDTLSFNNLHITLQLFWNHSQSWSYQPNFSSSFLRASCGSLTVTLRWPCRCKMLAHRFPMIPAPRIRILDPTAMGVMRSQPWATHDSGSVRPAAQQIRSWHMSVLHSSQVTDSSTWQQQNELKWK